MVKVKRLAKRWCPRALLGVARWCYLHAGLKRLLGPAHEISTPQEVDEMIARCREAVAVSYDTFIHTLEQYHFRIPTQLPGDPGSPEYHAAQMGLYRLISGRDAYHPEPCEQTPFDFEQALRHPHPYQAESCTPVGEQLIGVGFLVRALGLTKPARVLEFGPGYGKLTMELAQMRHEVTAVDISGDFLELGRRRCRMLGLDVRVACADMLTYRPEERFDRVIFNESFHHCSDHRAMVARLEELVRPGGAVIFANEPISDTFYFPWGLRLDGQSLWAIRLHGWLELGFRTNYFLGLLARHGWRAERHESRDAANVSVIVARRR